jgi:hypothetical protein
MVNLLEPLALLVSTHYKALQSALHALPGTFAQILGKITLLSTVHPDSTDLEAEQPLALNAKPEPTAQEVAILPQNAPLVIFHAMDSKNVWLVPLDSSVKTPHSTQSFVLKRCTPMKVGSTVGTALQATNAFQTEVLELTTANSLNPVKPVTILSKETATVNRAQSDTIALVPT